MLQMPYVCLYLDYLDSFRGLSDAACGKLIKAMLHYALTGEEIQLTGAARILWPSVRSQLDRDAKKYQDRCETNRINGAKGGRPPKNPTVTSETEGLLKKPKKPKEKEKEKKKNNDNANENKKDNEKEKDNLEKRESPADYAHLTPQDLETLSFARRAEKIRKAKAHWGEDVDMDSLIPLGTPIYPQADSSEPDKWLPGW